MYIVATRDLEEGEEVTLGLETANSSLELVCCLPSPHNCQASTPQKALTHAVPVLSHKKNGLVVGYVISFSLAAQDTDCSCITVINNV